MSLTDRIMKIDRTDPAYISALIEKKPRRGDPKEIEIVKKIGETVLREEWAKGAFSEISLIQKDYLKEMIANAGKHNLKYAQVPIQTIYSDKYKGTTVVDGLLIVGKMIGWRLWK